MQHIFLITSYAFAASYLFLLLICFTQENWISHFKPIFLSCRNHLFDLHEKLTDWGSS